MSDAFPDRYWASRYWASRFFQGGDQNPGSMRASLSGAAVVSAVLHERTVAAPVLRIGGSSGVKSQRRILIVSIKASLSGASRVGPEIRAVAQLAATVTGDAVVSPAATGVKDFSKVDAAFWFMAA